MTQREFPSLGLNLHLRKSGAPQDHVLEVLQGQPPIMVAVCFIQYLLTDQGHLLSAQLPTGQPGHRLPQVPRADVVVIVEVCEADSRAGTPGGRRTCLSPGFGIAQ